MISGTKGGYSKPYTSISFTSQHSATRGANQLKEVREQEKLEKIASNQALEADLVAYWSDNECLPQEQDPILRNGGLYRMCDFVCGAEHVIVVLPSLSSTYKCERSARM